MRVLFLLPVLLFVGVSATFNVLFSLTLNEGGWHTIEGKAWVALGVAAALYSGLGLDIARTNFQRGAPSKGITALAFLIVALAWDARCAFGFASLEQDRARHHAQEDARKRDSATARVTAAKKALESYTDAPEPIAADAAVDVLAKRTNDARCALRNLPGDQQELCDQLSEARIAAARAHAKTRLADALKTAESELDRAPAPTPQDAFSELVGPTVAKWLPAIVLQLGTLLGMFAAAVPQKQRAGSPNLTTEPPSAPAPAETLTPQAPRALPQNPGSRLTTSNQGLVDAIAELITNPSQCPPGLGVDGDGWLTGSQRRLATKLGVPVSKLNIALRDAAKNHQLEMDTTGNVTRLRISRQ
jgi:hypothetical protein